MKAIVQNIFDNPILVRELRRRMRGKALVYSIIGYIILMTITSILILLTSIDIFASGRQADSAALLQSMSATGRKLFESISIIQALLVLIIAPTITAGMTTGEKEKKTFEFLRVTTISPWMYITGCFLSTVFYVSLALICALPLISLAFLYGGVGGGDVLLRTTLLMGASMVLSAFGLLISSTRERTRTAQGIVVFMIFSLIFGGAILIDQIQSLLGSGNASAAAGAGAATASAGFSLMGFQVPMWAIIAAAIGTLTAILLLVATRKLFEPEEARAVSHWQYAVLAVAAFAVLIGLSYGTTLSDQQALTFMASGCLALVVAALGFAVGRMEVGDEIWHLKRLVPFLRPIDQTVPFLIAVGAGWYLAVQLLKGTVGNLGPVAAGLLDTVALVSLAGYAFFCTFGRFATAVAVGRKGAGRMTLALVCAVWIVLPLLVAALIGAFSVDFKGSTTFLHHVGRLSPFFVMFEGFANDKVYKSATGLFSLPGLPAAAFFAALALVFLAVGEVKRHRRWRGFDYHYDMPSR